MMKLMSNDCPLTKEQRQYHSGERTRKNKDNINPKRELVRTKTI
jgi:hypothetical protein